MNVLVRINVSRILANKTAEVTKLAGHLIRHRCAVMLGNHFIYRYPSAIAVGPFTEIEMKSHAETLMLSTVGCGFGGSRPTHHQTSACHDALFMRFDDAPIYTKAKAKIVGIHD